MESQCWGQYRHWTHTGALESLQNDKCDVAQLQSISLSRSWQSTYHVQSSDSAGGRHIDCPYIRTRLVARHRAAYWMQGQYQHVGILGDESATSARYLWKCKCVQTGVQACCVSLLPAAPSSVVGQLSEMHGPGASVVGGETATHPGRGLQNIDGPTGRGQARPFFKGKGTLPTCR